MNMTTSLDNIPLKTSKNNEINNDDKDDPMVKDILNEFQQELEINTRQPPKDEYQVKYTPQQDINANNDLYDPPRKFKNSNKNTNDNDAYYNQEYVKKTAIIIIVIIVVFSPFFLNIIIEKLPISFAELFEKFDLYIKLLLSFFLIYILYLNKIL